MAQQGDAPNCILRNGQFLRLGGNVAELQHRQLGQVFRGIRFGLPCFQLFLLAAEFAFLLLRPACLGGLETGGFSGALLLAQGGGGSQQDPAEMVVFEENLFQQFLKPAFLQFFIQALKQRAGRQRGHRVAAVEPA